MARRPEQPTVQYKGSGGTRVPFKPVPSPSFDFTPASIAQRNRLAFGGDPVKAFNFAQGLRDRAETKARAIEDQAMQKQSFRVQVEKYRAGLIKAEKDATLAEQELNRTIAKGLAPSLESREKFDENFNDYFKTVTRDKPAIKAAWSDLGGAEEQTFKTWLYQQIEKDRNAILSRGDKASVEAAKKFDWMRSFSDNLDFAMVNGYISGNPGFTGMVDQGGSFNPLKKTVSQEDLEEAINTGGIKLISIDGKPVENK